MDNNTSNGCGLLLIMLLAIGAFFSGLVLFNVQNDSAVVAIPTIALQMDMPTATVSTEAPPIDPTTVTPYNTTAFMITVLSSGDLSAEAVELVNTGATIDLSGWQIIDAQGNVFTFPTYRLFAGGLVRVMTRSGENTPIALFWNQDNAIWSPDAALTLRDQIGTVRAILIVDHAS